MNFPVSPVARWAPRHAASVGSKPFVRGRDGRSEVFQRPKRALPGAPSLPLYMTAGFHKADLQFASITVDASVNPQLTFVSPPGGGAQGAQGGPYVRLDAVGDESGRRRRQRCR